MKLSKKVVAAFSMTAALAMAMSFVGCKDEEDENGVIEVSGKKATVNYTNESSTDFARAFKTLNLDRTDATCKITIDRAKSSGNGGVIGFMFNEKKDKVDDDDITEMKAALSEGYISGVTEAQIDSLKGKEYYDFSIAGIGLTQPASNKVSTDSNARTYVSVFEAVDPSSLSSGKDFTSILAAAKDSSGNAIAAEKADVTKEQTGSSWVTLSDYEASDNVFTVYIKMAVQDDGSIQLDYYKDSDYLNNVLNETATAVKTITIDADDTGLTKKDDGGIGFYANVYASSTLSGSLEFFDLAGNAIAIEE